MNGLSIYTIQGIFIFSYVSSQSRTVPMVRLLEDGFAENFDEPVGKIIEYPQNYTGTEVTVCLWLQPYLYLDSNNILGFSTSFSGVSTISISLEEGSFIVKLPGCLFPLNIKPKRREWSHFCFSKSEDVKIFIGGQLNFTYDCETEQIFDTDQESIFFRVGWSAYLTIPLSGLIADAKMFWRELTEEEIKDISMTDYEISAFDLLLNLSIDNNSYAEITEIPAEELLEEYMPYTLLYISEKNSHKHAVDVCKIRRAMLPDLKKHGKEVLTKLILKFSTHLGISFDTFWLNSLNGSRCSIGIYTMKPLDIIVKTEQCNNSKIDYFCVVEKLVQYRLDGFDNVYEEDDGNDIYFFPVPLKIGHFESEAGYRLYLKNGQFILKDITSNFIYYISESKDSDQLLGRYDWHKPNQNKFEMMSFTGCSSEEFTCSNGMCIDFEYMCTYKVWCDDYSDEHPSLCEVGIPPGPFYDKKLPPSSQSNLTTNISIEFELLRLLAINKDDSSISIFVNCVLKWQDQRLDFKFLNRNDSLIVKKEIADLYWKPELVIVGATQNDMLKLSFKENPGKVKAKKLEDGVIKIIDSYRALYFEGDQVLIIGENSVPVTIMCDLNLFYFPFNEQTCSFSLQLSSVNENLPSVEFETSTSNISMGTGVFHSVYEIFDFKYSFTSSRDIEISIKFSRKYGAYIFNTILPSIVLQAIGLMTLLLPTHDYNDRNATTFSLLMTMSSLFSQISGSLPISAQPKLLDIWMFTHVLSLALIFLSHILISNFDDVQVFPHIHKMVSEKKAKENMKNGASQKDEISGGVLAYIKAKWKSLNLMERISNFDFYQIDCQRVNDDILYFGIFIYVIFLLFFYLVAMGHI